MSAFGGRGSLALGHPFGATGARLVMTAANRLRAEGALICVLSFFFFFVCLGGRALCSVSLPMGVGVCFFGTDRPHD